MTTHVTPPASPALEASACAPNVGADASRTSSRVRAAWIGFFCVLALGISVFWLFDALPFQDLPAHAGLIAMRHRFDTMGSPFEERFYVLAPHIGPYSLFRLLGEAFIRMKMSPVSAVRMLGTLPVIATPLALMHARRRLFDDRSPTFGFLGVALSFGLMTLLGFASYLLGVAFMLFGLTMWLELLVASDDRAPSARRLELVMAIFAPAMFFAHGHAFLLFLLCAVVSSVAAGRRLARLVRLRALVPALGVAAYVAWLERGTTTPPGSAPMVNNLVPHFHDALHKLGLLVTPTLMTHTLVDAVSGGLMWIFAIAAAVVTMRTIRRAAPDAPKDIRHSRALYACAAAIGVVFLVLPEHIGWFGFVDGRLAPIILLLGLIGVRRDVLPRAMRLALDKGAPVIAATIASVALVASYRFQDEAQGYREVLSRVPAESALLNLPLDPNSDVFTAHPFVHYDKLVLAERPTVVSDVWFHQGTAIYPKPPNPALRLPSSYSESNLKTIDWPAYHLEDWDYVLIRTRPTAAQPHTPDRLVLEDHRGGWWLFRRTGVRSER